MINADPTLYHWLDTRVHLAPEGVEVATKLDDAQGVRNVQSLKRRGNLWFTPDEAMYVYYRPTHWAYLS